jgi:hypothetical protein
MTTPDDPLLERLRRLPGPRLDDVTTARTLGRAEVAFASATAGAAAVAPTPRRRWPIPAALALWGFLYCWGAVREIGRLFAVERAAKPAVAANHRGLSDAADGAQFMLNAINKASASTTTAMTTVPPRPDSLRATSFSISVSVPVRSEVSSDMDPSMQVVVRDTPMASGATPGAGRGTIAARTAARSARMRLRPHARAPTPSERASD